MQRDENWEVPSRNCKQVSVKGIRTSPLARKRPSHDVSPFKMNALEIVLGVRFLCKTTKKPLYK